MHIKILSALLLASLAVSQAQDGNVEIQKQKLVKFPDSDFDPSERQRADIATSNSTNKADEAKRILEQIAKVNEAFGYVKKQSETSRLPPILDSSQYLFPKPAYQPFHAQQHHFSGSNGQTYLEPSIRAVKLTRNVGAAYNVPPRLRQRPVPQRSEEQLYYRPNQVQLPKPNSPQEAQQLPAHFVIPVRLYKLNKEQYLRERAPEEYRVKGYKIIGDVDGFYGKAKSMMRQQAKKQGKSTPKYHLFFLPRELALNEDGSLKNGPQSATESTKIQSSNSTTKAPATATPSKESRLEGGSNSSREKNRPYRPHLLDANSLATQSQSQSQAQTQLTRKRIGVKPLRNKETQLNAVAEQQLPGGVHTMLSSSIKITPAPSHNNNDNMLPNRNRLNLNPFRVTNAMAEMQNQTSTAIKNAIQNIFKPFRAGAATGNPVRLESVPLQLPQQAMGQIQPSYSLSSQSDGSQQEDYKWEDDEREGAGDEQLENNAAELDSSASAEKHLFHHKTQQLMQGVTSIATAHHGTQKQALREGGIIIQRLKVRKGGIAIAGPGGVATAGSGGTAIVGPGGYALTHPRSLTIAGPGAKVIAIPADVDLQDALQRTNLEAKSFPREGKVVAIGPTVYYAPPTGEFLADEEEEELEEQQEA